MIFFRRYNEIIWWHFSIEDISCFASLIGLIVTIYLTSYYTQPIQTNVQYVQFKEGIKFDLFKFKLYFIDWIIYKLFALWCKVWFITCIASGFLFVPHVQSLNQSSYQNPSLYPSSDEIQESKLWIQPITCVSLPYMSI